MSRARFTCLDCGVDTGKINEYYMLRDSVWYSIGMGPRGMMCIGCVELRLGRVLRPQDFHRCYLNSARTLPRSQRLAKRLGLMT